MRYPLLPVLYLVANLGVIAFKVVEALQHDSAQWFPLLGIMLFCSAYAGHLGWTQLTRPSTPTEHTLPRSEMDKRKTGGIKD